ncbi:MAG: sodium-dependent transporter, partial [Methylococcales bacterium]|nr:sodium-dependent transporter [Methylococcales bacterium]
EAVGHAFFTLSLGMGAMITYGSYLSKDENLIRAAASVVFLDTLIALLAGLVIFSVVFSFDLEPSSGPGLIFATLPVLFAQIPGGAIVAAAFFVLVLFAATTSAVSLLEVVVAYWTESHKMTRAKGTFITGGVIFILGMLSVLSTNVLSDFLIFGKTFFDLFDYLTTNFMLPIGGILILLFFGWKLGLPAVTSILGRDGALAQGLMWSTRVLAPIAILLVLYNLIVGF